MSVFGFIENFFFVSLALVFILVVLLVYHFKNRITIAEKKSESMYGLLTAIVKEIKILRGRFGLGGTDESQQPPSIETKSKTVPEVNIPVSESLPQNNTFSAFQSSVEPAKEVITFEISASENKIVVSDCNGESESESESDSESESEQESDIDSVTDDSDSDSELDDEELNLEKVLNVVEVRDDIVVIDGLEVENLIYDEVEVKDVEIEPVEVANEIVEVKDVEIEPVEVANEIVEVKDVEIEPVEVKDEPVVFQSFEDEPIISQVSEVLTHKVHTVEQLRKMNINQLKTIAFQLGISTDVSKMKKPELISLIQSL